MAQISKYKIDNEIYDEIFNTFLQTIVNINSKSEAQLFFNQFLTSTEKIMFSKRLAIGILIARGLGQRQIMKILKVSAGTISSFTTHYKYNVNYKNFINKILLNKKIDNFMLTVGQSITNLGTQGRKGTSFWKELNKSYIRSKSKLIQ